MHFFNEYVKISLSCSKMIDMTFIRQLSIRIDEKLSNALEERAKRNKRSLNGAIIDILENMVFAENLTKEQILLQMKKLTSEIELLKCSDNKKP